MQVIIQAALTATGKQVIKQVKTALKKDDNDDKDSKAKKIAEDVNLDGLDDINSINDHVAGVASDAGNIFLAGVDLPDKESMFDRVNDRAVTYAKENGAELVSGVDQATRNDIASIISKGLTENIGMDAIADNLESAYSFSPERAELIARTEIANANSNGVLASMNEIKDAGINIQKEWIPDALACPVCQANGDDGAIDLEEPFSSGDLCPLAHPRCRCTMGSVITKE